MDTVSVFNCIQLLENNLTWEELSNKIMFSLLSKAHAGFQSGELDF